MGALLGQQKYKEAEPLLLAGYDGLKQHQKDIPPQGRFNLADALRRLVALYDATGRRDEADRSRKELQALEEPAKKPAGP